MRTGDQNSEQKNLKNLNFGPKRTMCKVGDKGDVVAEEIGLWQCIDEMKSSTLYRDKKKNALRAKLSARLYPLQPQVYKNVNFHLRRVTDVPCLRLPRELLF